MKLVVGLGNPGPKYAKTRHNIGFITLDEWAYQHDQAFDKNQFKGDYFDYFINGEKVIFLKPQTFMNLSGEAVIGFVNYYQLADEDVLVVYDDMDMNPGRIRLRAKGSAGGHNGMKNIINHMGTQEIQRLKIGVGRPAPKRTVVDHVLSAFPENDHPAMLESVKTAAEAITYWLEGNSFTNTMNRFN